MPSSVRIATAGAHSPRTPDRRCPTSPLSFDCSAAVVARGSGLQHGLGHPRLPWPECSQAARKPMMFKAFTTTRPTSTILADRRTLAAHRRAKPNEVTRTVARRRQPGGTHQTSTDAPRRRSRNVIELHGSLHRADARLWRHHPCSRCRSACGSRPAVRARPTTWWEAESPRTETPTSTRQTGSPSPAAFRGGAKPDVVFFGERLEARGGRRLVAFGEADALLVVGSSLTVFSGYRFVRRAARDDVPVAIVNLGPTRGDDEATIRLDAPLSDVLPRLVRSLPARPRENRRA